MKWGMMFVLGWFGAEYYTILTDNTPLTLDLALSLDSASEEAGNFGVAIFYSIKHIVQSFGSESEPTCIDEVLDNGLAAILGCPYKSGTTLLQKQRDRDREIMSVKNTGARQVRQKKGYVRSL